ncbi:MAG: hypothetical protein DRP89_08360, partial [Candidatus Neomarinimicrobiota bacterium]
DSNNNPVSGVVVSFSATAGTIQSQAITDNNGFATAVLTSSADSTDINATVTASLGTQNLQTTVVFQGVTMTLSASPGTILADGQSKSLVTAILKRTTSHVAIAGAVITFGTDLGTIPSEATTNSAGVAQVSLTSGTTTGTAHVTASYGVTISDSVAVSFQESVPSHLEVSATPSVITADGESQSVIKATVSDASGNPVAGVEVTFQNHLLEGSSKGTLSPQTTVTNTNGLATSTLTSAYTPGKVRIYVSVSGLQDSVDVVFHVGDVDHINVVPDSTSLPADGVTKTRVVATVLDANNNPIEGKIVDFSASIGDITPSAVTDANGTAIAQYSSGVVGMATITATSEGVSGVATIRLRPGEPNSIVLRFDPTLIGVRGTGQNQTTTVEAEVRDSKNNVVKDSTLVQFSIVHGSGGGESLSSTAPIPTVGGIARVSLSSGTVSGNVRVKAEVVGNPIVSASSEILIHAGPPYIENINDLSSTHLTIVASRLNIWQGLDTTKISIMVGDKYNNPVDEGTAVYLTTSGGVINTHTAYTDAYGKATVILTAGNPQPTVERFYNYDGMHDPNDTSKIIPGPIPDFDENGQENDGIARVIAYTEGMDALGNSARAWDWLEVVYSGPVIHYVVDDSALPDTLHVGQTANITIELWDSNGNPIVSGSDLSADLTNGNVSAALSWTTWETGNGMGTDYYPLSITNIVDPTDPDAKGGPTAIKITVNSINTGKLTIFTKSVYISKN